MNHDKPQAAEQYNEPLAQDVDTPPPAKLAEEAPELLKRTMLNALHTSYNRENPISLRSLGKLPPEITCNWVNVHGKDGYALGIKIAMGREDILHSVPTSDVINTLSKGFEAMEIPRAGVNLEKIGNTQQVFIPQELLDRAAAKIVRSGDTQMLQGFSAAISGSAQGAHR